MPRKILLVDQSASIRRILRAMIHANFNDAEISEAEDSNTAMDILLAGKQHVVLFSWESSNEQWFDFIGKLQADPDNRRLNFIVFTSRPDEEHFRVAREAGVSHRLTTPCSPETLTEVVNQACNPALLRNSRRYSIPGSTALLTQGAATLNTTIINISTGGMLCEMPLTEQLNWTLPLLATVNFPAGNGNDTPRSAANLFAVISSIFVQKRHSDNTPEIIRVAIRFLSLPTEATETLSLVFDHAEALEKGLD